MNKKFMQEALDAAKIAYENQEIPIGAIVVYNGEIIGYGYNRREQDNKISSHAEIMALEAASSVLGTWKLEQCELYVTVEPCLMCYGAILQSRIRKIYVGAKQHKFKKTTYRHFIETSDVDVEIIELEECRTIMQDFFQKMRNDKEKKC